MPVGGCIVSTIEKSDITCACHGSAFSVMDGSLTNRPATKVLGPTVVTVKGNDILVV